MSINKKSYNISLSDDIDKRMKNSFPFVDFNHAVAVALENVLRGNLMGYNNQIVTDTFRDSGDATIFMTKDNAYYRIQKIDPTEAEKQITIGKFSRADMGSNDSCYMFLKQLSEYIKNQGIQIYDNILIGDRFRFNIHKNKMDFGMNCIVLVTDQRRYLKVKFEVENTNYRSGGRALKRRNITSKIYKLNKNYIDDLMFKEKYCETYTGFLRELSLKDVTQSNLFNLSNDILQMINIIRSVI